MVREKTHPLTTAEAKARLREAAEGAGVGACVRRWPTGTVLIGLAAGFLVSKSGRPAHNARRVVRAARHLLK